MVDSRANILVFFFLFLKEYGIVANYTMPGTPEKNDIAER